MDIIVKCKLQERKQTFIYFSENRAAGVRVNYVSMTKWITI